VYIAYNRRFFASTLKAQQIIKDDGGVTSFRFEFTEWPSRILSYEHAPGILENWFYHNSTHVVDLAFYLGGEPDDISAIQSGELIWHKPAIFTGGGRTGADIPFSYHADWTSAGRWWVEVMTTKRKLILCPMEQLKEQLINQVQITDIDIDNKADVDFKPGFLKQVEAFYGDAEGLMNLEQQISHWQHYNVMTGRVV
jgi:predicted dehydrogenase